MRKRVTYLLLIVFLPAMLSANTNRDTIPKALKDSTLEGAMLMANFGENLDSLLNLWYIQNAIDTNDLLTVVEPDSLILNSEIPDSVYIKRLDDLQSAIKLSYNRIVRNFINVYTDRQRDKVEVMLGLGDHYFPIFEEVLIMHNLPIELRILPVIESALNPRAVSRVGATGIWQFMYGTGRMYNLTINSYIDERKDPIKSTHAAVRFLKDLYSMYNDWNLAIAAYNCGPGNVNKAIRRAGGKTDYWDIYYYLPRETRGYVPAFIAASYAFQYYSEHNMKPVPMSLPATTDTLMISNKLHFKQVSEYLGIPLKTLRDLNPQYKMDVIPAVKNQLSLKLPLEYVGTFIDNEKEIFAYKDSVFFDPNKVVNPSRYTASYRHNVPPNSRRITYKVKSGDVLGIVAENHGVRVSQLRSWNNLRGSIIRVGQKLTIYVHESTARKMGHGQTAPPDGSDPNYVYYRVQRGDTLWDIARLYPGISSSDIKRINNLRNDKLMPGQVLKIKPKAS